MKRFLFLCLIVWSNYPDAQGQVVLNLQLPPAGITVKEQLWNMSLVNSGAYDLSVQLEMTMTDVANNQRVLTAITRDIIIPKGAKQIRQADIMPVTYNIVNTSYPVDANPSGFLPVGIYNICYTVVATGGHEKELISDECETVEIEPLSPPVLVIPSDMEKVETGRPLFSWTPPSPLSLFSRLSYDFTLVEVSPLQSPGEALQQNIPICFIPGVNFTSVQYPATLTELDTAKTYAWKIKAKNNERSIADSEIWTLTVVKKNNSEKSISYADYAKLKNQQDAAYITMNGVLNYQYNNESNDAGVHIRIYDITAAQRSVIFESDETLTSGANFKTLTLKKSLLTDGNMYLLELSDNQKEKSYLKFAYKKK